MNYDKHIWEGWRVKDFIEALDIPIQYETFSNREQLKKWCMDNQPYYKKHIPEVVKYFNQQLNL